MIKRARNIPHQLIALLAATITLFYQVSAAIADLPKTPSLSTPGASSVLAVVDGTRILKSDFERKRTSLLASQNISLPNGAELTSLNNQVLQGLIEDLLFLNAARQLPLQSREEIASDAKTMTENFKKDPQFAQFLKVNGKNAEQFTSDMTDSMLIDAYKSDLLRTVKVNDFELRAIYKEQRRQKLEPQTDIRALHIALDAPSKMCSDQTRKAERLMEKIHAEMEKPYESVETKLITFFMIARKYSVSPMRSIGGYISHIKPGTFPKNFEKEVFALNAGEVSRPFQHKDQLLMVAVIERKEPPYPKYDQVKQALEQSTLRERAQIRVQEKLRELFSNASVKVYLPDWHAAF